MKLKLPTKLNLPAFSRSALVTLALAAAFTGALTSSATAANRLYRISSSIAATAEFNFSVTLIPVPGRINAVTAALSFDPQNLAKTSGTVNVALAKLDTGIGLRDEHARGYIGADKHPNAVFTLTRIVGATALVAGKEVKATVLGRFELNGVAIPLSAPITLKLIGKQVNVSTAFTVTLADHNISIPGSDATVGVKVNFNLEPNS
jgi:polyisoprenoid-binding protein YceI